MGYALASEILNDAATLLGLEPSANVYASTDPNFVQLRALLKSAGRDLVRDFEWAHLRVLYTLTTTPSVDTYTMPAAFDRWVNQTQWNRTARLPLGGPVTPQGWGLLKTLNVVASVQLFFRTKSSTLYLHPVPSAALDLALEYVSAWWVQPDGQTAPTTDEPTANTDTVCLDSQMMVHRLRRDFLRLKQFDSTAASEEYERALARAKGSDEAAPVLNLNYAPYNRARLLDGSNIPPTGFGS